MQYHLDQFSGCHVAVIGDLMLDHYIHGEVSRISPEAPVPVLRSSMEHSVPGGAANVAANLAALGLHVHVAGLTGQDRARELLIRSLESHGDVNYAGILSTPTRQTTQKIRIVTSQQQIVRIDHEDTGPCDAAVERRFIFVAREVMDTSQVVVLSDYGKGALSELVLKELLRHARATGKRLIVDPKRRDFSAYRGAWIVTPNRKELSDATGLPCESDEQAAVAAASARQACGANILLTRSEKGMSFFPADGKGPMHLATAAKEVFDVSGAGDTVVAAIAAALAAGLPIEFGMKLANHAASIVLSKPGTAVATFAELENSLATEVALRDGNDAVVTLEEAVALRDAWARQKLTVGFTNGCFDLLHPGHVALIKEAAASCDRLIVALNSDSSVRRLKGPARPVQDEAARAAVMSSLKGVSAVILFRQDTPLEAIEALRPDVLVKGSDYTEDEVVGASIVRSSGGRVLLVDLMAGHSTSRLVEAAQG